MYVMPGTLLVGFCLRALASSYHCIAAASTHMGGSPTTLRFPGMQVKPLLPSRRTTNFPCASVSMILAAFATFIGPADIARAILTCVESSPAVADLLFKDVVWAEPRRSIP